MSGHHPTVSPAIALCASALLCSVAARGQNRYVSDPPSMQTIRLVTDTQLATRAVAEFGANARRIIRYNPNWWLAATPVVRRFVFLHEWAHHERGDVARVAAGEALSEADEQEADCEAMEHLRREGWSDGEVSALRGDMASWPAEGAAPAGTVRAQNLETVCHAVETIPVVVVPRLQPHMVLPRNYAPPVLAPVYRWTWGPTVVQPHSHYGYAPIHHGHFGHCRHR